MNKYGELDIEKTICIKSKKTFHNSNGTCDYTETKTSEVGLQWSF